MSIRILVIDDHSVVRKGIRMLLEDEADIQIVGEAADGTEAIDLLPTIQPDVLLLDITMPKLSGIETLKIVSKQYPGIKTLMFSMHNNPDYILNSVQNGAAGYLLKDTDQKEILQAVRTVVNGDLYYPPNASSIIIKSLVKPGKSIPKSNDEPVAKEPSIWSKITAREEQILTCLVDGMSSSAIADRFGISINTVANQRASIIRKAGVKNTVELIRLALQNKPQQ